MRPGGRWDALLRSPQPPLMGDPNALDPNAPKFSSEQERAQRAIDEFQKVAAKYGDPYRTEARYFIGTNLLVTDRAKGMTELAEVSKSSICRGRGPGEICTRSGNGS